MKHTSQLTTGRHFFAPRQLFSGFNAGFNQAGSVLSPKVQNEHLNYFLYLNTIKNNNFTSKYFEICDNSSTLHPSSCSSEHYTVVDIAASKK